MDEAELLVGSDIDAFGGLVRRIDHDRPEVAELLLGQREDVILVVTVEQQKE